MAREGFDGSSVPGVLLQPCARSGWALCIGAGTSVPAFPRWSELVRRLLEKDVGSSKSEKLAESVSKTFSPVALLQAAQDRLGCKDENFAELLSSVLYKDIKEKLGGSTWAEVVLSLSARHHGELQVGHWDHFLKTIQSHYPSLSEIGRAHV